MRTQMPRALERKSDFVRVNIFLKAASGSTLISQPRACWFTMSSNHCDPSDAGNSICFSDYQNEGKAIAFLSRLRHYRSTPRAVFSVCEAETCGSVRTVDAGSETLDMM